MPALLCAILGRFEPSVCREGLKTTTAHWSG